MVLYVLVKFVIGLVVGAVGMFVVCLTCCCAALPYIAR